MPLLLVGVAAVSYVEAYLPYAIVTRYLTGVTGVVLGAVIGVPLYTPTLVEVFLVKKNVISEEGRMLGIALTPALAIDGKVIKLGSVPSKDEVKAVIERMLKEVR